MATKFKETYLKSVQNSSLIPGQFTIKHVKSIILNNTDSK